MSWINLIQEQVANGFDILDDLVNDITWTHISGEPVFDDGEYTYPTSNKTVGGVLSDFKSHLIDGDKIQGIDRELLVRTAQVDDLDPNDKFTIGGRVYQVLDWMTDPAGVTLTIHLRPV